MNEPNPQLNQLSVLTANVGNLSWRCRKQLFNLCDPAVEARITTAVRGLRPGLAGFQELSATWQEAGIPPYPEVPLQLDGHQARRILGPDYSIALEPRTQFLALGVHNSVGRITGVPTGGLQLAAQAVPPVGGCDQGFSILAVPVDIFGFTQVIILVVHLNSRNPNCRIEMLRQADEIIQFHPGPALVMGDFNMDPWRKWRRADVKSLWEFTANHNFTIHNENEGDSSPALSSHSLFWGRYTFDLVLSDFLAGGCASLGRTPGTQRIDGGKGMDHNAVLGQFNLKSSSD